MYKKMYIQLVYFISYYLTGNDNARLFLPSGAAEFTLEFQKGSCCSVFGFLCIVLQFVVCPCLAFCSCGLCLSSICYLQTLHIIISSVAFLFYHFIIREKYLKSVVQKQDIPFPAFASYDPLSQGHLIIVYKNKLQIMPIRVQRRTS